MGLWGQLTFGNVFGGVVALLLSGVITMLAPKLWRQWRRQETQLNEAELDNAFSVGGLTDLDSE